MEGTKRKKLILNIFLLNDFNTIASFQLVVEKSERAYFFFCNKFNILVALCYFS